MRKVHEIMALVSMLGIMMQGDQLMIYNKSIVQPTDEDSNQIVLNGNDTTTYKIWEANQLHFVRGNYFHMMNRLPPTIEIGGASGKYNFHGVYFINCKMNPNFDSWIMGQAGKWPTDLDLYIEATSKDCEKEDKLHAAVEQLVSSRPHSVTQLNCHTEQDVESHEYYGIRKAWQLGKLHPGSEDVVFYFHSKGITHRDNYTAYEKFHKKNARATTRLIESTGLVKEVFDLFPSVAKLGMSYSKGHGWIWHNYWYARGSYLDKTDEPRLLPTNRYYYESWLGKAFNGQRSDARMCYSTEHALNIGEYFDANAWKYRPDPQ